MITGIGHTAYRVSDLEVAKKFYCDVLGLEEMFTMRRDTGEVNLVYLRVDDTSFIELFPNATEKVALTNKTVGYAHLCLNVDDMQKTLAELAGRGLALEGQPKHGGDGNWQFWITDPDGNRIELMQMAPDGRQAKSVQALAEKRAAKV